MKLLKSSFIAIIFLAAFIAYPAYLLIQSQSENGTIKSPLPDILTHTFPSVLGINESWSPIANGITLAKTSSPSLTAKGIVSYDLSSDTLIYEKNFKERMPMASITKIMTAIIALENSTLDKEYKVSKKASEIGENSMGLSEGEILTLEELLYGLIMVSGNDAAEVIAEGSRFGRDNFVYLMNKKAEDLGLSDTNFTNPSGLEGDGEQYSTPHDLLVITKYALENPVFAKISATVTHEIHANEKHKGFYLFNETNLLTSYPGVKGVKTGYTFEAGLCLVTYLEHEDRKIIAVLLNAQNRRQEMKDLLDYSLRLLGETPPPHS